LPYQLKIDSLNKTAENTPLIKQYFEMKSKHPDALLLFRVGDFYEAYGKDALDVVDILNITLTRKSNGAAGPIEMAGFPHHAMDNYLYKLVRAGRRVAICDQLEDPKMTKKLVKRGITELVTPGVSTNDQILDTKENNFLAGLHIEKNRAGVAFLDLSTGEFLTSEGDLNTIDKLLNLFAPKEIIYERSKKSVLKEQFSFHAAQFEMEDWVFSAETAQMRLTKHFNTVNLKGFGIQDMPLAIFASGAILYYMDMTEHKQLSHIQSISRIEEEKFVRLDRFTIRSLELCNPINEGGKSLLNILDKTKSSMGARLMRRWILFPLKDIQDIQNRQDVVDFLIQTTDFNRFLCEKIASISDIERIASKISVGRVNPREMVELCRSFQSIDNIIQEAQSIKEDIPDSFLQLVHQLNPCKIIMDKIGATIVENPPIALNKGTVVKEGVDLELDELRKLSNSGKDFLLKIQEREVLRTGISSLRISFNNVFGYYIEVRNSQKDKVPEDWIRKQTLVNAERYITQELKDYEEKILGAEEKIQAIESRIYNELMVETLQYIAFILKNASIIAQLDCLLAFSLVSMHNKYVRPQIEDSDVLDIVNGRHPVIETQLPENGVYVPNSVYMDGTTEQILMITGPNMAGKSAFLRQTAIIVLMAQMGCFVPVEAARIGLVDKVFTRVGASDNISSGESTFMMEMNEASNIINNLSQRSLVLFDELGRGTSTYDGISIAWSIVEYIHEHPKFKAKTLFATHYHELNEMEKSFSRIRNYHISVRESEDKVLFLRKLVRGGTEHSFGIHVAKMAGMPQSILKRANHILDQMENENRKGSLHKPTTEIAQERDGMQLSFFQLDDPILSQIRDEIIRVDIDHLTPIEALNKLSEIKKILKGK
jgi:DNA mismatch repair protein MutS